MLTIGTDNPAFPPWFQDAKGDPWDPTSEPTKMGYEAAVAYAVAGELGFSDAEVTSALHPELVGEVRARGDPRARRRRDDHGDRHARDELRP
jgi:hypothetical protein